MLVEKGYFPDVKTVFDKVLYHGGPLYVPYTRRTIDECVALIRKVGGLAVLAHPGLLKRTLDEVLTHDFDGVEVYHPKNRGRFDEFLELAKNAIGISAAAPIFTEPSAVFRKAWESLRSMLKRYRLCCLTYPNKGR